MPSRRILPWAARRAQPRQAAVPAGGVRHVGRRARGLSACKPLAARAHAIYLSFFFGRSWLVWPHFFLRQLTARGGRRA